MFMFKLGRKNTCFRYFPGTQLESMETIIPVLRRGKKYTTADLFQISFRS